MGFIWVLYGFGKPWVSNQTLGFQINTLGFAINIRGLYGFYTGKKPNPTFFFQKVEKCRLNPIIVLIGETRIPTTSEKASS